MPQVVFPLTIVTQHFSDAPDCQLSEAIRFPEFRHLSKVGSSVGTYLSPPIESTLLRSSPETIYRSSHAADVITWNLAIELPPPRNSSAWREPLRLSIPVVQWRQANQVSVVYIPAFDLEILSNRTADLEPLVLEQVRVHLLFSRTGSVFSETGFSALKLVELTRCQRISVTPHRLSLEFPSTKQRIQERQNGTQPAPVLPQVAERFDRLSLPVAYERDAEVERLAELLGGGKARSVLLVGPSGVGKTALVHELARRKADYGFSDRDFWSTSGSRLVAGATGFGMWQQTCERLRHDTTAQRAILHFGSLWELMEVGKGERQSQSIASFLRPSFASGELQGIVECTPEQLALIEQRDASLIRAFQQLVLTEPNFSSCQAILRQVSQETKSSGVDITDSAIEKIERLHRRFATYSAQPARPLRFLDNLLTEKTSPLLAAQAIPANTTAATVKRRIETADITIAFARETGLPLWVIDEKTPLDLQATESWFSQRVIGQAEAVSLVVNLLGTIKAGLSPAGKPLASFLFIGPTGVGKTEMAKALAEFIFGVHGGVRNSRLIRIDMSEYADPQAVQRLIGGTARREGILTSRVREQPFSVVLLDEFEKAHHTLFDLLLQVLGEGRLTDSAGRVADFRNSIVIMTSNLGATPASRGSLGFGNNATDREQSRGHYTRAVREFVRPEFFGRIDRVVPFHPLDRATALQVVQRELQLAGKRDGVRHRRVTLELADRIRDYLVETGFQSAYGARGLKRQIDRELLIPLAEQLNTYPQSEYLTAHGDLVDAPPDAAGGPPRLKIDVQPARKDTESATTVDRWNMSVIEQLRGLRTLLRRIQNCSLSIQLQNEAYNLNWQLARLESDRQGHHPTIGRLRQRLKPLLEWQERSQAADELIVPLEEHALLSFYLTGNEELHIDFPAANVLRTTLPTATAALKQLAGDLYNLQIENPDWIRFLLLSRWNRELSRLGRCYLDFAVRQSWNVQIWRYCWPKHRVQIDGNLQSLFWEQQEVTPADSHNSFGLVAKAGTKPVLLRDELSDPRHYLHSPGGTLCGLALAFTGSNVRAQLEHEPGRHRFEFAETDHSDKPDELDKRDVHVFAVAKKIEDEIPWACIIPPDQLPDLPTRRIYNFVHQYLKDEKLTREQVHKFSGMNCQSSFEHCLNSYYEQLIHSIIQ